MEDFIYDGSHEAFKELTELQTKGAKILCHRCKAELIVALDLVSANKFGVHPGIYCPVNPAHVYELVELADVRRNFWKRFESRRASEK
jgi:hypothetical protein